MDTEMRRGPRYPFFAHAEITETERAERPVKLVARTSDLGQFGCYMDMRNPFPLGTPVSICITYEQASFHALGKVIYSQHNVGMGISFDSMELADAELLEKWVAEIAQSQSS